MKAIETYDKLKQPPAWALKEIGAGRLKNMTQINPQWRYQAMTEQFGLCGVGWKYEVKRLWTEPGAEDQVLAFAEVALYIETFGADGTPIWSSPIPGVGGSMLTAKESKGLHSSDECYKMAITDALSVAMKMIGVGADVYAGAWNGEGYKDRRSKEAIAAEVMQEIEEMETKPQLLAYWKEVIEPLKKEYGAEWAMPIFSAAGKKRQSLGKEKEEGAA